MVASLSVTVCATTVDGMTRAATARNTRKRFIEASTGGAKSDRVAGVLSQREVPRKDPAAPRLFRPRGSRLHEGRVVLAGRLTGPRSSWDTLAVPARAKPTESSPVPLDAKVEMDLTLQALA